MDMPPLYIKLWTWMLLQASHKDHGNLKRGQFFTTTKRMQKAMLYKIGFRTEYPSERQIKSVMKYLTKNLMKVSTKVPHGQIITILNYDKYQNPKNYEGQTNVPKGDPTGDPAIKQEWYKQEITTSPADAGLIDKINSVSEALYRSGKFPKVHAFKNKMLKDAKNHNALLHALNQVQRLPIKAGAWAYCTKIMQIENGNYNEADYVKTIQKQQRELEQWMSQQKT